jgi:membrane protease YdiL (CAAX protease family)
MKKSGGFLDSIINVFWNPAENRPRAIIRLIIFVIVLVFCSFAITMLFYTLFSSAMTGDSTTTQPLSNGAFVFMMVIQLILYLAPLVVTLWFMAKYIDRRPLKDFGFQFGRTWWRDLAFGLSLGAALMSLVFFLERILKLTFFYPSTINKITPIPFWLGFIVEIFFYISVAFYEEALVRGYLMKNVSEGAGFGKLSSKVAIIIGWVLTAIVFGYLHQGSGVFTALSLINLILLGLLLGAAYMLTGNLALPIGIHTTWNLFQGSIFGFPVSGTVASISLLATYPHEPYSVSGGLFGPEAGLIVLLPLAVGAGLLYLYIKLTRKRVTIVEDIAVYKPLEDVDAKEEKTAGSKKAASKKK